MWLPIWKTAKYSPKATPPRRAGTKAIIPSRWRNRFPKSCWSICVCIIPSCSPAIPACWLRRRFPKLPDTEKLQSTTGAIRAHQVFPENNVNHIPRSIWWSSSALPTSALSLANHRGTSVPCKAFPAGGKSVTCTQQTAKEVRRKNIKVSAVPFEAADTLIWKHVILRSPTKKLCEVLRNPLPAPCCLLNASSYFRRNQIPKKM